MAQTGRLYEPAHRTRPVRCALGPTSPAFTLTTRWPARPVARMTRKTYIGCAIAVTAERQSKRMVGLVIALTGCCPRSEEERKSRMPVPTSENDPKRTSDIRNTVATGCLTSYLSRSVMRACDRGAKSNFLELASHLNGRSQLIASACVEVPWCPHS